MVYGTLPSYDICVYEILSNYFHLLKSYAVDMQRNDTYGQTDGWREGNT